MLRAGARTVNSPREGRLEEHPRREYDARWRQRNPETMRFAGGAAIGFSSFPIMFVGLQFLWCELRSHIGHPFYVEHDYLWGGAVWLAWGLVILALGGIAVFRRKGSAAALVLGIMLLIAAAIALPSIRLPRDVARVAHADVRSAMLRISVTQSAWAKKSGRFPANQRELDEFVKAPVEKERELVSRFARDAQRLPYRLIYIADAPGPHISSPAGDQPGMIYCAVSRDQKRFWITGTAYG